MSSYDRRKNRIQKRRKSTFVKGYTPWNDKLEYITSDTEAEHQYVNNRICRPEMKIYKTAVSQHTKEDNTLPTKLRPRHCFMEEEETEAQEDTTENIIVNFCKLKDFIKKCLKHRCRNKSSMNINISNRMGICISLRANCAKCQFDTNSCKVYTECEKKSRGPAAGYLHEAMTLAVLKTKMGGSDLQMTLACLNIRVPSLQLISNNINKQCDKIIQLNEEAMIENQRFVKEFNTCIGKDNEVDVETDTAYNNRNQVGYEAGTQSFCPLIEQNTGLNLPISMSTANKLCSRKKICNHSDNQSCKKNYNTDDTIASSEGKLAEKNLQKVNDQNILKVKSVTSDASAQLSKVVREFGKKSGNSIRYYQCFVHRMRTVQKYIKNLNFSKLPPGYDKDFFRQRLATCIRSRVRLELVRIHKISTEHTFGTLAQSAIKNIVSCFSGNHANCKEKSEACCAHLDTFNTKYLPYGVYLNLNVIDKKKIESALNKSLSLDVLNKISSLHTTNQCESLHHRVFTYAPKSVLHKRNFNGLCHSACHSSTFGTGKSSILLAKSLGLNFSKFAPFFKFMIRKDIIALYHSQRKKTAKYKIQKFLAKCKKQNRRVRQGSMYSGGSTDVNEIHNYGINENN